MADVKSHSDAGTRSYFRLSEVVAEFTYPPSDHQVGGARVSPSESWRLADESVARAARALEVAALERAETIALLSAGGARIDRIQTETRALLEQLVNPR